MKDLAERYYLEPAAAFARAHVGACGDDWAVVGGGLDAGLRLYDFKRKELLPRVRSVLGVLHALQPQSLLDVGSGRGVFLWPLLDAFRELPVTAIDVLDHRLEVLEAVHDGGVERLDPRRADVAELPFEDRFFDVATVLEVLEHLREPGRAVRELLRVSRRFVIASVPSKKDDNPEHIQLFDAAGFADLFRDNGAADVQMEHVLNHRVAVAKVAP